MEAAQPDYVELWVIYERPSDFPQGFVVRRQRTLGRYADRIWIDPIAYAFDTLDAAREAVPYGMTNIGRTDGDPVSIKEVWI